MKKDITIEEIETVEGVTYNGIFENQGTLPDWYRDIRSKKLSQLSDGDLTRLIRQGMYIEYILHECINRLYKNPFGGEKYDGEIIEVLSKKIDGSFWSVNEECKKYVSDFLTYFKSNISIEHCEELDEFEKDEILKSISQLSRNLL